MPQHKPSYKQWEWQTPDTSSPNCGHAQHNNGQPCPATGQKCARCGKMNNFARVCRAHDQPRTTAPSKPKPWQMGLMVSSIVTQPNTVTVQVTTPKGQADVRAIIDIGSDWCCLPPGTIKLFGEDPHNRCLTTAEMT